ncbi:reverse transcriptase domain-containing protein [Pseudobutyrivibrio sp.]
MNENIIGYDALYESMLKCKNGVMWKDSAAAFVHRGLERISSLAKDLQNGSYKPSKVKTFNITSPKPREIASISFRDRVYQRSLNDNEIYPTMTKHFIYDNYACQKGKGTDNARERLKEFLHEYYRTHGNNGYVAQFDIKGYYPNMIHINVENIFQKNLSKETYQLTKDILHHQYDGEKGYNPGSQLIQIAGISLLNGMDHYIKEDLHAHFYIRYMDDFLIIHDDRTHLEYCFERIKEWLYNIGFEFNEKKSVIYEINRGIPFLGFVFSITNTGKVLMQIKPELVKAKRKHLKRLVKKAKEDNISRDKIDESYYSWRNHAMKGNSYKLICKMDKFYNDLWREESVND